ncbi:M16 family metallopeptidase [Luteibaculum oceani]|uniref:Insulinase family protein n=1 Tax=Luteibaculum oceani TaxID=1294296 RepID=A0A5C6V1C0_9FLAO|nr:pitrilysin family protein [Luteibaculum oceani]TXC78451.1 insulinase family protein [Luteibaculum oceani]
MLEFTTFTLSSGLRVVHCPTNGAISNFGVVIDCGSRDETDAESGLAHFIEHTIFKGTQKRKAYHVLNRLDSVGGEINAYTGKEDTAIHSSFLNEYYERAIELTADILFNSSFPEKEIEKEKEVVIDEINSYLDSPSEQIFDDFEEQIFKGHPLANPILGSKQSVRSFKKTDIQQFIDKHYGINNMVLCSAGKINLKSLKRLLEKYFGHFTKEVELKNRKIPFAYQASHKESEKKTNQAHFILGSTAPNLFQENRPAVGLLNNILGGPGLNSHLNLYIREKYGIAYNIESHYTPYIDTGSFFIYLGTDFDQLKRSIRLINGVLGKLRNKKLGTLQLHQAKKQLIGHIALNQESNSSNMLNLAKSLLIFNKIESDEEVYRRIYSITSEEVLEAANLILDPKQLSSLTYL